MAVKVRQVPPVSVWPSGGGWTVGILELSPDALARRFDLEFEEGRDDLDTYKLAAIAEPQIGQFWLFAHTQTPQAGTEVLVDREISRDIALGAAYRALGLDLRAFAWVSPYAKCPPEDPTLDPGPMTRPSG
jgi:hypothetical protein